MILEGIVTTLSADGSLNIAPMGPRVDMSMQHLLFRPFRSAQTYRNLKTNGEGVFHVTDDVLLLARSAIGPVFPLPDVFKAKKVNGLVLAGACRFYEFRVKSIDDREERSRIEAETIHTESLREFFGFNRAKHAVVEAAILATRTAFIAQEEIEREFRKIAVIIEKTGGEQEQQAFEFLNEQIARLYEKRPEE